MAESRQSTNNNNKNNDDTGLRGRIADFAKKCGADIVGFASVAGFGKVTAGSGSGSRPDEIMPGAATVIGLGFRVLRGAYRGIEEGSTFYQYYTMAVETVEEAYIPQVLAKVTGYIEDEGYCAVSQKLTQLIMKNKGDTNPEVQYRNIFRGVEAEAQLDFRQAAVLCGLGEIGLSGSILTDDFGPNQRFAFIITDALIEPDQVMVPHICDKCGKCLDACPGSAFGSEKEKLSFKNGNDQIKYEINPRDNWQCAAYYKGANMHFNPFMPEDALEGVKDRMEILRGEKKLDPKEAAEVMDKLVCYPQGRHSYVSSICGKACDKACFMHLEEIGALKRQYHNKFRKKAPWKLDIIAK